jgi:4'-phosphopantetheinyl transferase
MSENVRCSQLNPADKSAVRLRHREVAALTAEPAEKQQYRFFEYWTLEVSYIKARGMGLALPLHKFGLHYSDSHSVKITIDQDLGDDAARWMTTSLQSSS